MPDSVLPFPSTEDFSNGPTRTLTDFWRWAYSDILTNTNRATLAEYLVACALEVDSDRRIEWNYVDLIYKDIKIEVKSSGYVQSWKQNDTFSNIQFDIEKKFGWDSATTVTSKEKGRSADVYVFVLYEGMVQDRNLLMDLTNWTFFLVETKLLDSEFGDQKKIGLEAVKRVSEKVEYHGLKGWMDSR